MDKEKYMVDKNRFMKSGKKNWFILTMLTMLALWVADGQRPCLAVSIAWTGSASTTWAIGTKGASQTSTSTGSPTTWTIWNDSAGIESITIQVTGVTWTSAASAWTTGAAAGSNVYVLTLKSPGDTIMGTTATTLAAGLAGGGTKGFGLAFTTPSTSTEQGAHTLTITLTAVTYNPCGAGSIYNTYCWYKQDTAGGTCAGACASHGGFNTWAQIECAVGLAVLTEWYPGGQYVFCVGNSQVPNTEVECTHLIARTNYYSDVMYGNVYWHQLTDSTISYYLTSMACPCNQ